MEERRTAPELHEMQESQVRQKGILLSPFLLSGNNIKDLSGYVLLIKMTLASIKQGALQLSHATET